MGRAPGCCALPVREATFLLSKIESIVPAVNTPTASWCGHQYQILGIYLLFLAVSPAIKAQGTSLAAEWHDFGL